MFFRNLCLFRFPRDLDFSELDQQVAQAPLKPVGPLEMNSRGFINPFGRNLDVATHRVDDAIWVSVGGEDKILPGAVVNDQLQKKCEEIFEREGRYPGGKTRRRLKDDLLHELLPKAFVEPKRTDALIDARHGFIAVDVSSRKTAENVVSELRGAMGSFPAVPINAEVAPRSILTGWLAGEVLPEGLSIGDECEMRDPIDGGAVVTCKKQEMRTEEIDKHLEAGKLCTRLALVLDDHISFVLGEDLVIRKLKFLEGAVDGLESSEGDDLRAELDARFVLMSAEVRRLFAILSDALKFSAVDDHGPVEAPPAPAPREPKPKGRPVVQEDGVDPLLATARQLVTSTRKPSISHVQRVLKIGYNRAARLVESLEVAGVLSPPAHNGDRTVLVDE